MTLKIQKNDRHGWAVLCPLCGVQPGTYGQVATHVGDGGWLFHYGSQPEALRIAYGHIRDEHDWTPEVAR